MDLGVAPPGGQVAGVGDRFLGFDCQLVRPHRNQTNHRPRPVNGIRFAIVRMVLVKDPVQRVIVIVLWMNVAVAVAKGIYGHTSGSLSVASDAIHSLLDAASNVVGIFFLRLAKSPPDPEHPYGHHKIETMAAARPRSTPTRIRCRPRIDTASSATPAPATMLLILMLMMHLHNSLLFLHSGIWYRKLHQM